MLKGERNENWSWNVFWVGIIAQTIGHDADKASSYEKQFNQLNERLQKEYGLSLDASLMNPKNGLDFKGGT